MQGPSGVPIPEPMDERSVPSVANELTPGDGAGIVVPQGAAMASAKLSVAGRLCLSEMPIQGCNVLLRSLHRAPRGAWGPVQQPQ